MGSCECRHCQYTKEVRSHLEILSKNGLEEQREFFSNMYDFLISVEYDNDRNSAILDGTWPNAREILERSLNGLGGSIG